MVVMCSPHRDAGGPIQFLSPTHIHHVDATSALKQLRHSLSRSPSKGPTFRFLTSKSASPSPSSPLSPSPLSPPNRSASTNLLLCSTFASPSSWAIPYPPSARKNRLVARKVSPMRTSSRSRNSPHSPVRTALADSTDHGNATPSSSADSSDDVENSYTRDHPSEKTNSDSAFKANVFGPSETYLAPLSALPKLDKGSGSSGSYLAKSSPLKRSDGIMNLDQANLGSPSAKRRSLHGGSFSPDFDIFDHEAASLAHFEPRNTSDGSSLDNPTSSEYHNVFSPMQKRTSSLRKTTLQQRYEKPTFARSKPNTDLALDFTTPGQVAAKGRNRMSLDGVVPSIPRDSPFSSQSSLPNASVHPMSQQSLGFHNQVHPPRHPLSRTITQSSSSSSMAEDSPTHIPHRQPDTRKAIVDFSKSLPVGAARPTPAEPVTSGPTSQTSSSGTSFATPDNYKLAKPLPAAFMSTGLISKRNKNMDDSRLGLHDSRSHMPDTPCKRPISMVVATPVAVPESAIGRARQVRHSFGTPSTPFGQHVARPAPEIFGKGVSIFGGSFGTRRGSFVSVDGEELLQSPSAKVDSQSSNDFDFPPTPTKQVLGSEDAQPQAGDSVLRATNHQSRASASMGTKSPGPGLNCKLVLVGKPSGSVDGDSDSVMDDSPSAALSSRSYSSIPSSFTHSRSLRNSKSPTPLSKKSYTAPSLLQLHKFRTKPSPQSPASPIQDRFEHLAPRTPHTPHENMIPPDPSGLSISANVDGHANRSLGDVRVNALSFPPATPTASKDYFSHFGKSRSSITPIHGFSSTDVDPSLTSRFERVELIGTGEFSQVYRVTQKSDPNMASKYFPLSMTHASPKTPMPDRVWAVKKSRHAYVGGRDRQRKLQEVTVLKALGQADHTVCLFDNWEEKNHLYIQTEFCEEGSLDMFLDQVGRKARLDDFRIWKIMLELSQGLKHIHDSGFIHLDLKPANVLITFEGLLKIGDFGMATAWPAQPGIDGEGDREYIGPEVLKGQFDKPVDVFALGLIMLEIAGNVMLPENGLSWQRLRTGDMSDVPSLTWSSETSNIFRDESGKPLSHDGESAEEFYGSDSGSEDFGSPKLHQHKTPNKAFRLLRSGELAHPPNFMIDANHPEALDKVVRWMISPEPADRPIVDQVLSTAGVQWADARRRAGATIYEGNWGPADDVLTDDAEMIDV